MYYSIKRDMKGILSTSRRSVKLKYFHFFYPLVKNNKNLTKVDNK